MFYIINSKSKLYYFDIKQRGKLLRYNFPHHNTTLNFIFVFYDSFFMTIDALISPLLSKTVDIAPSCEVKVTVPVTPALNNISP